ncbi:nucleotidyltransferase domain-containing protein [candidate division WOR-3 bacterium]|nr:nucleotidyltransferase domain-containing protein [candidate division WOR-3 bacterium]
MVEILTRGFILDAENYKSSIKSGLSDILKGEDSVSAVWEGGSAATGFEDKYSDLDLAVICSEDFVEEVFSVVEDYITKNHAIEKKFRLSEPTWHGNSQCFYKLENSPKFYYIDLTVIKESSDEKFTASDRHGNAVIWFDKKGVIDISPTRGIEKKCSDYFRKLMKGPLWLLETEIRKNCERGNFVDAKTSYDGVVNRYLASLLNLRYRSNKYDFGLRYARRDYPGEIFKKIESFLFISRPENLPEKFKEVMEMIEELTLELGEKFGEKHTA